MFCFDTAQLISELSKEYKEVPLFYGNTNDNIGSTMSFWLQRNGESWTVVLTKRDLSCVVANGTNLKLMKTDKPNKSDKQFKTY